MERKNGSGRKSGTKEGKLKVNAGKISIGRKRMRRALKERKGKKVEKNIETL